MFSTSADIINLIIYAVSFGVVVGVILSLLLASFRG